MSNQIISSLSPQPNANTATNELSNTSVRRSTRIHHPVDRYEPKWESHVNLPLEL